jgi:FemAB-related protein (PEP-CTERM system-associated)
LFRWREVIDQVMGHECIYRCASDERGDIKAVLPLARVRNRLFGNHLISLPFLNYGGPIGERSAEIELAKEALALARREQADSFALRSRHEIDQALPTSSRKVTVLLPLPSTAEELWEKAFNAKFRNKIKRPQREGMETRFGVEQLDGFYEVFAQNMRDLGTPVLPRLFFERVVSLFPDLVVVGATYWKDRVVAAGFGFCWRDEFEMTWSSSRRELGSMKPNMLLYWDFMRLLIRRGMRTFNFGRSTPGTGPHEFKLAWGGTDAALPWVEWPNDGHTGPGIAARIATAGWRHLPLNLANRLGPHVARTLPWW